MGWPAKSEGEAYAIVRSLVLALITLAESEDRRSVPKMFRKEVGDEGGRTTDLFYSMHNGDGVCRLGRGM
jgi:hypothetical protein